MNEQENDNKIEIEISSSESSQTFLNPVLTPKKRPSIKPCKMSLRNKNHQITDKNDTSFPLLLSALKGLDFNEKTAKELYKAFNLNSSNYDKLTLEIYERQFKKMVETINNMKNDLKNKEKLLEMLKKKRYTFFCNHIAKIPEENPILNKVNKRKTPPRIRQNRKLEVRSGDNEKTNFQKWFDTNVHFGIKEMNEENNGKNEESDDFFKNDEKFPKNENTHNFENFENLEKNALFQNNEKNGKKTIILDKNQKKTTFENNLLFHSLLYTEKQLEKLRLCYKNLEKGKLYIDPPKTPPIIENSNRNNDFEHKISEISGTIDKEQFFERNAERSKELNFPFQKQFKKQEIYKEPYKEPSLLLSSSPIKKMY